jgi:hypothetical protein
MGWMGDRKYQYPDTLAQEIISTGLHMYGLRAEIYAQLMKQLTHNPSSESVFRCAVVSLHQSTMHNRALLTEDGSYWVCNTCAHYVFLSISPPALLMSCFPPPENFENFVAQFLRTHAPGAFVHIAL